MNDIIENLMKINKPVGRNEFFKYSIVILISTVIISILFWVLTTFVLGFKSILWLPLAFTVFVLLPLMYLYFVQSSKRLWDIAGNKNTAIVANILIFIMTLLGMINFPPVALIIYLVLILLSGKIVTDV